MKISLSNMLLLVTIIALAISLVMTLLAMDPVVTVLNQDNDFSFEFRQALLKDSPRWSETEDNPPLSVRKAMEIADSICDKLNAESRQFEIGDWGFDSLTFSHLNFGYRDMRTKNSSTKWCYIVHLQTLRSQYSRSFSQAPETASFMILMDGTVFVGENSWSKNFLKDKMLEHYPASGG